MKQGWSIKIMWQVNIQVRKGTWIIASIKSVHVYCPQGKRNLGSVRNLVDLHEHSNTTCYLFSFLLCKISCTWGLDETKVELCVELSISKQHSRCKGRASSTAPTHHLLLKLQLSTRQGSHPSITELWPLNGSPIGYTTLQDFPAISLPCLHL